MIDYFLKPVDPANQRDKLIQKAGKISWDCYKTMVRDNHSEVEAEKAADALYETLISGGSNG